MGQLIAFRPRLTAKGKPRRPRLANIRDARRKREVQEEFANVQRMAGWGR